MPSVPMGKLGIVTWRVAEADQFVCSGKRDPKNPFEEPTQTEQLKEEPVEGSASISLSKCAFHVVYAATYSRNWHNENPYYLFLGAKPRWSHTEMPSVVCPWRTLFTFQC